MRYRACLQVKSPFNTSCQNLICVTRRASQTLNGTQTMEQIHSSWPWSYHSTKRAIIENEEARWKKRRNSKGNRGRADGADGSRSYSGKNLPKLKGHRQRFIPWPRRFSPKMKRNTSLPRRCPRGKKTDSRISPRVRVMGLKPNGRNHGKAEVRFTKARRRCRNAQLIIQSKRASFL